MEFGQVHHIEYYVNDLQKSNQFWSWFLQKLSYTKFSEWDSGISWKHKGGTYLVFCQVETAYLKAENTRQGNGLNHIAFMGGTLAELDQLQAELESRNIKILKRKEEYLCFEDPNDFAVEVYARSEEQK
jgi:catechol 2,3-dioxygenase-like lactoylglutathione lyase family enzyme